MNVNKVSRIFQTFFTEFLAFINSSAKKVEHYLFPEEVPDATIELDNPKLAPMVAFSLSFILLINNLLCSISILWASNSSSDMTEVTRNTIMYRLSCWLLTEPMTRTFVP